MARFGENKAANYTPAVVLERLAAGSPIHGQPELRSSSGARPGDRAPWRESQAHGVSARRLRGKK